MAGGLLRAFVPGRMEHYQSADGAISVIVDYSHNGMSLRNALSSVRQEYPGRELTVLFGCTGGKGIDRREGMGNAAGELADRVILTEDDPGPEAVEAICADIGVFYSVMGRRTPWCPTGSRRWSRLSWAPGGPPWFCWRARAARPSKSAKAAPSPASRTGSWPGRTLERYDGDDRSGPGLSRRRSRRLGRRGL